MAGDHQDGKAAVLAGGPGMDEHRNAGGTDGGEQVERALGRARAAQARGGQAQAGGAAGERLAEHGDLVGGREPRGHGGPEAERVGQRGGRLVPGADGGERLGGGQALDPDGSGQRDERAVHALVVERLGATLGVVVAGDDREGRLAVELDDPGAARARGAGRDRAPFEHAQDRFGPEVLMDVDGDHRHGH